MRHSEIHHTPRRPEKLKKKTHKSLPDEIATCLMHFFRPHRGFPSPALPLPNMSLRLRRQPMGFRPDEPAGMTLADTRNLLVCTSGNGHFRPAQVLRHRFSRRLCFPLSHCKVFGPGSVDLVIAETIYLVRTCPPGRIHPERKKMCTVLVDCRRSATCPLISHSTSS